jgi:hypothetical protein
MSFAKTAELAKALPSEKPLTASGFPEPLAFRDPRIAQRFATRSAEPSGTRARSRTSFAPLCSSSEMTRSLLHRCTRNNANIGSIMEATHDGEADILTGFRGEQSDHQLNPLL